MMNLLEQHSRTPYAGASVTQCVKMRWNIPVREHPQPPQADGSMIAPTNPVTLKKTGKYFYLLKNVISASNLASVQQIKRKYSNAELIAIAKRNPPPQHWFEGDMKKPF